MKGLLFFSTLSLIILYFATGVATHFPDIVDYTYREWAAMVLFLISELGCVIGMIYHAFFSKNS